MSWNRLLCGRVQAHTADAEFLHQARNQEASAAPGAAAASKPQPGTSTELGLEHLVQALSRAPQLLPSYPLTLNLQSQSSQWWGRSLKSNYPHTSGMSREWQCRCKHASPQLFHYRSPFPSPRLRTPSISIEKPYRVRNNCLIVYHEDY